MKRALLILLAAAGLSGCQNVSPATRASLERIATHAITTGEAIAIQKINKAARPDTAK